MKSIMDEAKIKRRRRLSNFASVGGLIVLLASVVMPLVREAFAAFSVYVMFAGLAASMVGIYFANRWVKKPRPEDSLNQALKGLSDKHRLYHYASLPCDHVLLGPAEVVVLETINLEGLFSYQGGRWREAISFGRALRYIVEEHLGDPLKSAQGSERFLKKLFSEEIEGGDKIPVKSMVVFVHPRAELKVKGAPIPVCTVDKLRRHFSGKESRLPVELYEAAKEVLDARIY
jgi:hypothetical protein